MNNLRVLRKAKKITQVKLAEKFGIAGNTLCQYEKGQRQIPDEIKIQLAQYFGVTVDYLLGREAATQADGLAQRYHIVREAFDKKHPLKLSEYEALPPDDKKFVEKQFNELVDKLKDKK